MGVGIATLAAVGGRQDNGEVAEGHYGRTRAVAEVFLNSLRVVEWVQAAACFLQGDVGVVRREVVVGRVCQIHGKPRM